MRFLIALRVELSTTYLESITSSEAVLLFK